MSMSGTCKECLSLWREFTASTTAYVEFLKEQEHHASVDPVRFRALDAQITAAAARRDAARTAVLRHVAANLMELTATAAR
jgi:hypothetical protein